MPPGKTAVKRGQVIQSIVQHSAFDAFFGAVVIANAFFIGVWRQKMGGREWYEWMWWKWWDFFRIHVIMSQKLWKGNSWKHKDWNPRCVVVSGRQLRVSQGCHILRSNPTFEVNQAVVGERKWQMTQMIMPIFQLQNPQSGGELCLPHPQQKHLDLILTGYIQSILSGSLIGIGEKSGLQPRTTAHEWWLLWCW